MADSAASNVSENLLELAYAIGSENWNAVKNIDVICANIALKIKPIINYEGLLLATIMLTDDAALFALNAKFRDQPKATNVLSFPNDDEEPDPETGQLYLGDIAISYETVAREADEAGKTLDHHLTHMIVHGVLHLAGFDHENDEEAEEMESLEIEILGALGIANPYLVD